MIRFKGIEIDRRNRTISHRGITRKFSPVESNSRFRMAVYFLLAGGASKEMAFLHIYGNDADGGPLNGESCLSVMLTQLQQCHLRDLGLEWRSWKIAGAVLYEIVPIFELPTPKRPSLTRRRSTVKISGADGNLQASA